MDRALAEARAMVLEGRLEPLCARLRAAPALVQARWPSDEPPYDGYFNGATLLHHTAGNPSFGSLPANSVDIAAALLDAGASVDARTRAGPSQPRDPGWTTLGLVASSLEARRAGVALELIDLLLERGADVDDSRRESSDLGLPLIGALYYGEAAAAEHLVRRGATIDFVAACGLGRRDLAADFINASGEVTAVAHRLVRYALVRRPARPSRAEILDLGLVFAARGGHAEMLTWLVHLGADPNRPPRFDHHARALHWAAGQGDALTCQRLLQLGADPSLRDTTHEATPADWARHAGYPALAESLERRLET